MQSDDEPGYQRENGSLSRSLATMAHHSLTSAKVSRTQSSSGPGRAVDFQHRARGLISSEKDHVGGVYLDRHIVKISEV